MLFSVVAHHMRLLSRARSVDASRTVGVQPNMVCNISSGNSTDRLAIAASRTVGVFFERCGAKLGSRLYL